MKAMLFAAGLGTRLKPFTDHNPKALAEVNNRTLLEHNLRYLQRFGIYDVIINVHHFADMIEDALYENGDFGSNVTISDERGEVLETGGGLLKAASYFGGRRCLCGYECRCAHQSGSRQDDGRPR
jgi:MurNAc alpha-1-phosphate uridylyltransferase